MNLLITGSSGFIGTNLLEMLLDVAYDKKFEWRIRSLDRKPLDPWSGLSGDFRARGHEHHEMDIVDNSNLKKFVEWADVIIHLAAESHVDESLERPSDFVKTNYDGTVTLLEYIRQAESEGRKKRLIHLSTDEVYGSSIDPIGGDWTTRIWSEDSPLRPSNHYAATKAASDMMVQVYSQIHKLQTVILRPTNVFGPYQDTSKFIPRTISELIEGRNAPLYGDGQHRRSWMHAYDLCHAIISSISGGFTGVYNVGVNWQFARDYGNRPPTNREVVQLILDHLNLEADRVDRVEDRPNHDRCYEVRSNKFRDRAGWNPTVTPDKFADALRRMITGRAPARLRDPVLTRVPFFSLRTVPPRGLHRLTNRYNGSTTLVVTRKDSP